MTAIFAVKNRRLDGFSQLTLSLRLYRNPNHSGVILPFPPRFRSEATAAVFTSRVRGTPNGEAVTGTLDSGPADLDPNAEE